MAMSQNPGSLGTPKIVVLFMFTVYSLPPFFSVKNLVIIPTNAACCPEINIKDVVLSNKLGEIAENTAYTQSFLV